MWKVLAESVAGTSHRRTGTECQDASLVSPVAIGDEQCLVIACSDGAGSASHGGLGARTACAAYCNLVASELSAAQSITEFDAESTLKWFQTVRGELLTEAERRGLELRDLACTLLTSILSRSYGLFAQVGDGVIVLGQDSGYRAVTWPTSGDYVNMTTFLTAPAFEEDFEAVAIHGTIDEVAVTTDGLQRLALEYASKSVHSPFFAPMFKALRQVEFQDELAADLRLFLDSDSVNERTDDDKTLVLAVWGGPCGTATL